MLRTHCIAAVGAALVLAACAQVPPAPAAGAAPETRQTDEPKARTRIEPLPAQALTPQILYQSLLAEVAAQRGNFSLAQSAYLDLAKATRDPRIAHRAAEIALHNRDLDAALEAARLWVEDDPESPQARQMLAGLLVGANRLDELSPHVAKLLAQEGDTLGDGLLRLNRIFARHPDKKAVLRLVEQLTLPYIDMAEAHFARAQAAQNAGAWAHGVEEIDRALARRPDWDAAVMLKAQLQQPESAAKAVDTLHDYLSSHPKAREVRLQYARGLVGERKYKEARAEFQRLVGDYPNNSDVIYAVAVLSLQLQEYDLAEENFRKLLEGDFAEANTVRLYLGQIAEERKHPDEAANWYAQVTPGEQYLPAQMRIANVLGRQGRIEEARRHLHEVRTANEEERVQLLLAEAQLLRDAGKPEEAFDLIERSLAAQPEQTDLLYEMALLAEKTGRKDLVETNLRKVIRLRPDYAHAYNALGYSFAERNERLPEAHELIVKALQLAPDDPFILDSMGWVLFRMNDPAAALVQLQRAFAMRPDPEIAAHLGEVLWTMGRRGEARKTWRDAAKANPGNEVLAEVIKRLDP